MITESFDNRSEAIINPQRNTNAPKVDACIITFSHVIEQFVLEHYDCEKIGALWFATGETPIWRFSHQGKQFAFYKTYVGAPASAGYWKRRAWSFLRTSLLYSAAAAV